MSRSLLEVLATIKPLCKTALATIDSGPSSSAASMLSKIPGTGGGVGTVAQMIHDAVPSEQALKDATKNKVQDVRSVYRQGRGDVGRAGLGNLANQVLTGARADSAPTMRAAGGMDAAVNRFKSVAPLSRTLANARGVKRRAVAGAKAEGTAALNQRASDMAALKPYLPS